MCSWQSMESVECVILAAGTWCEPRIVQRLIAQATSVLACDGALDACIAHGIHVTEVIGDLDSVSEAGLKAHIASGGDVHQFQSQESNDLEKALGLLEERKKQPVRSSVQRVEMHSMNGPTSWRVAPLNWTSHVKPRNRHIAFSTLEDLIL